MIEFLNVGRPQLIGNPFGPVINSGIKKKPVTSAYLNKNGFAHDEVADHDNHGGEERAVCFYPFEHYSGWNALAGQELKIPAFGENITLSGYTEDTVYVGDIYQIGDAAVQITQSRIPCAKVDIANRIRGFFELFIRTGKTGYFGKVVKEGQVEDQSAITLIERPSHTVSIRELHHLFFHDRQNTKEIERVLSIEALAGDMRNRLRKLIK
ncbi:MOSC domain-containing protein [Siminovitchia sediminis]|uniref:MOSC domain-containing protein n=1 Tax=Siminovitchia sediminis TaxID=1274353 RepID=A0ABW4KK75_9BACI